MTITKDNIIISNKAAPDIPENIRSLGDHLLHKLSNEHYDRVLFVDVDSGRQWKGKALRDKILSVAEALIEDYQLKQNDTVCIMYHNSDLSVILTLGVLFAGGAVLLVHPKESYRELLDTARKTGLKLLCCHQKNIGWCGQLEKDLGHPVGGLAMDGVCANSLLTCLLRPSASVRGSSKLPVPCKDLKTDIAFITMSSGTTGLPKAVPATHFNCLSELLSSESNVDSLTGLTVALSFSLDYLCDRFFILCAIHSGYRAVIINGFEPSYYLRAIEEYKINQVQMGAAAFYNLITSKDVGKYDLSSLELASPLGAKLVYVDVMREFLEKHPHIECCINAYGTTETSTIAAKVMTPQEFLENHDNSGMLKPGLMAKIVDSDTGEALKLMAKGLCYIKGPTVFPGYLDLEKQREVGDHGIYAPFDTFDEDGFYNTGDICYFNEKEELFVVGRHKEMMWCRCALKVVPQELEMLLSQHEAVGKVCILGIQNTANPSIDSPRAYIELSSKCFEEGNNINELMIAHLNQEQSKLKFKGLDTYKLCSLSVDDRRKLAENIMGFADANLGFEKQLTGGIVLLDKLPMLRASTGKIDKVLLRSLSLNQVEIYGDRSDEQDF